MMYVANYVQRLSCICFTWCYMHATVFVCLLMQLEFSHLFNVCFKQFIMIRGRVLSSVDSYSMHWNIRKGI